MNRVEMILLGLLLAGWLPGLFVMRDVWDTVESASHGYLVSWELGAQ